VIVAAPAQEQETIRRRGFGVAYRMLGSASAAEAVVEEAMHRLARGEEPIDEPSAWITTVATRLSMGARGKVQADSGFIVQADPMSQVFLIVLERLTPLERAAFLLHEVYDYDYPRIAEVVERTEAHCRQLVAVAASAVCGEGREELLGDPEVQELAA
jgi:RNA polymerase sigma-70 factor (ECF subfamily)